jgi:hypothetical protein
MRAGWTPNECIIMVLNGDDLPQIGATAADDVDNG